MPPRATVAPGDGNTRFTFSFRAEPDARRAAGELQRRGYRATLEAPLDPGGEGGDELWVLVADADLGGSFAKEEQLAAWARTRRGELDATELPVE